MRTLLSPALLCLALTGCAGDVPPEGSPPVSDPMQDLEPAGPSDAVLENEIDE